MASQDDLRSIAGKALADLSFREKLLADPEGAIKEAGIELTPEQMDALKSMDREQLAGSLTDLDERLTMGCWGKYNTPFCAWR